MAISVQGYQQALPVYGIAVLLYLRQTYLEAGLEADAANIKEAIQDFNWRYNHNLPTEYNSDSIKSMKQTFLNSGWDADRIDYLFRFEVPLRAEECVDYLYA